MVTNDDSSKTQLMQHYNRVIRGLRESHLDVSDVRSFELAFLPGKTARLNLKIKAIFGKKF